MSTSRKRKMENTEENNVMKWNNKESCSHAEKCFRKNPHHFREYNHPHLNKYLTGVIPDTLPSEYSQPRSFYLEQITIMKQLGIGGAKKDAPRQLHSEASTSNSSASSKTGSGISASSSSAAGKIVLKLPAGFVSMEEKLAAAAPYSLFFTQIPEVGSTLNLKSTISFQDLLCPTLGRLKDSLQINFIIDIIWLMQEYYKSNYHRLPMTVLYGDDFPSVGNYIDANLPNVKHQFVKLSDPFGTHHSKVGIYQYDDDSIRVVVSTANLYTEDWSVYNQCVWVSPRCPKIGPDCANPKTSRCGATGFKLSLIMYLKTYKLLCLDKWIKIVENTDFSTVNVFLVTSSPGYHKYGQDGSHLHRVGRLLSEHCTIADEDRPGTIITQSSSLGSYGSKPADWLLGCLRQTLATTVAAPTFQSLMNASALPNLRLVYPSMQNVAKNRFGEAGAGCLPYGQSVQDKQPWLNQYLCQWKADKLNRSAVMPHLKTYTRLSSCGRRLAYVLVTSANVSKAAWGTKPKPNADRTVYIRSYEAGILFLPKFFNTTSFPLHPSDDQGDSTKPFPLMYDLPLTPYTDSDKPWAR